MDFTTDGILSRMKEALKSEDTKIEGCFTMDNLQAVSEELARFNAMRIVPLMNTLSDKEDDMGTSGNPKHYVRWAKEATDADGNVIAGNAKVETPRDGSGFVSIAIITTDAKIPSAEQIRIVQEYIDGKRPVGADPVVSAAEGLEISIVCSFRKEPGYTDETVKQQIKNNVEAYFLQIAFQSGLADRISTMVEQKVLSNIPALAGMYLMQQQAIMTAGLQSGATSFVSVMPQMNQAAQRQGTVHNEHSDENDRRKSEDEFDEMDIEENELADVDMF